MDEQRRRADAGRIFRSALKAVDPYGLIRQCESHIRATYYEGKCRSLLLVSFGKAAYPMTKALLDSAGDLLTKGVMITKYGHTPQDAALTRMVMAEAAHPVPDVRGVQATEQVIRMLAESDHGTLVVCLISGGGSALLAAPQQDIGLSEKQQVTESLLKAGADIQELNTVRKHLSRVKGGRLAEIAHPARILSLILSDVIDDPLDVIASGPTSPDRTTFQDALGVVKRYGQTDQIPPKALLLLERGSAGEIQDTPKEGNPIFEHVENVIVGSNRKALDAAIKEASRQGYEATLLSSQVQGEARQVGEWLAQKAIAAGLDAAASKSKKICLISGGETVVKVGGRGLGGRNMELALAFAQEMKGARGITLLSAGTDGTDGPTDAAGAFADEATLRNAEARGLSPDACLRDNDSYHFFKPLGGLFITGPTGTNVMDMQIVLIDGGS